MNLRPVVVFTACLLLPTLLAAQYRGPRSADYLFGANAWGARALWLNPAGMGTVHEASVMAEALVERKPAGDYFLGQYSFGFNSRGFGIGYRRDRFDGGAGGNVWRFGLARGTANLAVGLAGTLYGGPNREEELDVGVRWRLRAPLELSLAVEHIGQPTVRGVPLRLGAVTGAGWSPFNGLVHVAAEVHATDALVGGWVMAYRAGLRLATPGRMPLAAYGVVDIDDDWEVPRLVFGLSFGGDYQGVLVGGVGRTSVGSRLETVSLTGVASHRFP
jgi:hypothetical protein